MGNVLLEGNYNDIWQESNLIKMSYFVFPFLFHDWTNGRIDPSQIAFEQYGTISFFSCIGEGRRGRERGGEICGESTNQTTSGRRRERERAEKINWKEKMEFSAAQQQVKIRKSRKKKKKKRWKSLFIDVCAPDFVSQRPGLFLLLLFLHFVGVCYVFLTYIL